MATIASAAGCANVKVIDARVTAITSEQLVVELVTTKDLRTYDKTYYADHVYLSYWPEGTSVSSEFENPGKRWAFPFSATNGESIACGPRRYCSTWNIPLVNSTNISANKYTYELHEDGQVRLRLGGGSMGGGRLLSNVVVIKVPGL